MSEGDVDLELRQALAALLKAHEAAPDMRRIARWCRRLAGLFHALPPRWNGAILIEIRAGELYSVRSFLQGWNDRGEPPQ